MNLDAASLICGSMAGLDFVRPGLDGAEGGVLDWIPMEECGLLVDLVMPILENIVSLAPSRSKDSASGSRG